MLPPLASLPQFEARLPGGVLTADDLARAEATLQDASARVRAEAGVTWVTSGGDLGDVPDIIVAIVCAAARRAFVNPDMVASESIQDYAVSFSSASPDIYLTKSERQAIRRAVGRAGLWTLQTTRSDPDSADVPAVTRTTWPLAEEGDPFGEGWV